MAGGWNSPSIPKLTAPDSPVPLTGDESSWVIVIASIGMLIFAYPATFIIDRLGRKPSLLLGMIPVLTGWLLTALANSLWMLLVARICFGIAYTFIFPIPIYLGEISSDIIRGYSITTMLVMGRLGLLFMFSVAPYLSISTMAWVAMAPPLLFLLTFIWMPESPYYLIGKDKNEEARIVLVKLRGHDDVDNELERIVTSVKLSKESQGTFRELISPDNRKGLVNLFVLVAVSFLSGYTAIQDYSQSIFSKIQNDLEPHVVSIILATVGLSSVFVGNLVIDRLGRKPLLLISITGCAICNTIVGVYFCLTERYGVDVSDFGWVPILALMVFIVSHALGLGLVIYTMLGEIFPKHLKAVVGGTHVVVAAISDTVVSKLFQTISDGLGGDISFGIFAICLYLAIPFVIWNVPETKGKPLDEILELMRPRQERNQSH